MSSSLFFLFPRQVRGSRDVSGPGRVRNVRAAPPPRRASRQAFLLPGYLPHAFAVSLSSVCSASGVDCPFLVAKRCCCCWCCYVLTYQYVCSTQKRHRSDQPTTLPPFPCLSLFRLIHNCTVTPLGFRRSATPSNRRRCMIPPPMSTHAATAATLPSTRP